MVSRNLYLGIITRCFLLAAIAFMSGWLFFGTQLYVFGGIAVLTVVGQVVELIYYLNRTNRQIAFFFDAVRNDDSTLRFPEKSSVRSLNDLNRSLNGVNKRIKQFKFELREQEQFFQVILEHLSVGIIVYNAKGSIILSNTAAKDLLLIETLTHINQLTRTDSELLAIFKELRQGDRRMFNLNSKKGVKQLSLKASLFISSDTELKIIAIQDIKNELDTKELESWIKLIRVLTHEIMNTIAPITSLSDTILGFYKHLDGERPSKDVIINTIKGLEVINERSDGLMNFVETYRKLTRIPPPDKKPVPVADLFEGTITLIDSEHRNEKTVIQSRVETSGLKIMADKKQISQVLINLVNNSLESLHDSDKGEIMLLARLKDNGRAQISVIDNGPGIPPELMDKIFVPFFTAKETGSGIGLSLSRQIMLMHGGSLKIFSEQGRLTEAILEF